MMLRTGKFWGRLSLAFLLASSASAEVDPFPGSVDPLSGSSNVRQVQFTPDILDPAAPGPVMQPFTQSGGWFSDSDFFQGTIGTYGGQNTGIDNGYMSLEGRGGLFEDGGNSALFLDGRLLLNEYTGPGGNLGLGYRRYLPSWDTVVGTNVFYDLWDSGHTNFSQIGAGVELLGNGWEARSNAYAPVGTDNRQIGPAIGFVVGNDIFATRSFQSALTGFDLEYGQTLLSGDDNTIKAFAGTYYYDGTGVESGFGVRGRAEWAMGSVAALNVSVQNDSIFDTTVMFGATFTLPGRDIHNPDVQQSIYNRLTDRVHRTQNIAVAKYGTTGDTGFNAFFVQQGATGLGTQVDPGDLTALSSDPRFQAGDVAFLINSGGTFTGTFTIDALGQQLIGSPDASGSATTTLPDGTILTQTGLGGRSTIDGQVLFNTGGRASGFDISSATLVPIYVDGLAAGQTATVDSVNVTGSVDDGIHIENSFGTFQFLAGTNGGTIENVPGDGIEAHGDVDVVLEDVTFNNIGMNAIRTNYTGTFIGLGDVVINNPGYNGIYLTNNVSTFQFENLTINGGGNGLFLDGFTGDFTVTGNAIFNQQVSTGIIQEAAAGVGNASNLTFGNLTIDNESGYAISLDNHTGTFTVNGAAVIESTQTLPVALGIVSYDSSTDYSFGSLDIKHSGTALALINHSGNFTVTGDASFDDYDILGIQSENSTTDFNFGSLSVTNGGGTAVALINHNGDFNVTNATTIDNYDLFGFQIESGNTDVELGSLSISNGTGIAIALTNNDGDFIVHDSATLTSNTGGGLLTQGGSIGDYSFGSLAVSNVAGQGYGVSFENFDGTFSVEGDADFTTSGQWGIQSRNSNVEFQFGTLDVIGTSQYAVALENHTGDFTVDGVVNFTDPWQIGMLSHNSTSDIHFGSLTASNTAQYAVALDNHTGDFVVDGDVNLTNVGGYGINSVGGSSGDIELGSLTVNGVNYVGLNVENGTGDVTIHHGVSTTGGNYGVQIMNRNGDVTFGSLETTGVNYVGFNVQGGTGDVIVENAASMTGGNYGVQIMNRTGDVSFGSLTTADNRYVGGIFSNINGNLNVTNDFVATNVGQGWYVDKAVEVNNVSGTVNFGSLAMDGNGALGLDFRNNDNGLTIPGTAANGGVTSSGFINGVQALDNAGAIQIGDIDITGTGGFGTGLYVARNNGSVLINGDATFTNTGLNGASITDITGVVKFDSLTVDTTSQNGLFARNISGDLILGDVDMDDTGAFGIFIDNLGGNTQITSLDVDGTTSAGVGITNYNGDFTVSNDTTIKNTHQGIAVTNSTTDLKFGDLTIKDTTGNGLSLLNSSSNVTVTGDATFDNTGASAIISEGSSSGDFLFKNLDVSTNWANGVSLNGHNGNFTVTEDATFTDAGGSSFISQGSSTGNYSFGTLTTMGNWTNNVALVNHTGNFTVTGDTNFTGANIGLQVEGGSGDISFEDLTITTPGTNGISFLYGSKNLTATGTTTITSPGANGVILNQNTGTIDFGNLIVTNPMANGITMAQFDGGLIVSDGEISGITSGQQAVFKHDSGAGSVTLENMIFSSTANDVFGLVTLEYGDGGSATLNNNQANFASGSTGTIGYRLGSFNDLNPVDLSGTNNTTLNAVEATQFDTFAPSFNGTVEVNGNDVP